MGRATPELALHYAVAELLERCALPGVIHWHTNNSSDNPRHGAKMKRMGVKPGVADFVLLTPGRKSPSFLELKSKTGRLSEPQLQFGLEVKLLGCRYEIARTLDEAAEFLHDIGAIQLADRPVSAHKVRRAA
jgi:hypothetical protein